MNGMAHSITKKSLFIPAIIIPVLLRTIKTGSMRNRVFNSLGRVCPDMDPTLTYLSAIK